MKTKNLTKPILWCGLLLIALMAALLLAMRFAASKTDETTSEADAAVSAASEEPSLPWDLAAPDTAPAGVAREDGAYIISAAGSYRLAGTMEGQITVNAEGPVELLLAGVNITGEQCLQILSDEPVTIRTEAGTVNFLADSAADASGEATGETSGEATSEPADEAASGTDAAEDKATGAVLFSNAPLTIGGEGALSIAARINNGIRCKDALTIVGGTVDVSAANNGLKARGALTLAGGTLSITADGDGCSVEAARLTSGDFVLTGGSVTITASGRGVDAEGMASVSGGRLSITAADDAIRADSASITGGVLSLETDADAIQAVTDLTVAGGELSILAGGGGGEAINHAGESFGPWAQSSASEDDASTKGLKCEGAVTITGGVIDLNTNDDCVHCGTIFTMDDGAVTILSNDDALHADDMLIINGGSVNITDCFEGLEAYAVEVHGGNVIIRAVNDGINANGPETMFGRSTQSTDFVSVSGADMTYYRQTGGTVDLVVTGNWSNVGDGVDSNGAFFMEGGVLTVSTRGDTQEGSIDKGGGELLITGGQIIAGGASMMQESISENSTQCSAVLTMDQQPAGTLVTILDSDGNEIWSATMANVFNCLVVTHPAMQIGNVYTVTYGNSSSTLDFTDTAVINSRGGWGFGRPF